ncbi:MAG: NUDIX domain-containing protein [Verrucomicrobia bacterium]|nr:NUDIX domain-containing protein [Verrucomicrobiota bacterium]
MLSEDDTVLSCSNAVAAIIISDDGRYLLQHRDDIPGIWYPNHWGCFGGAVDDGETPNEAIRRELTEELGIAIAEVTPLLSLDFSLFGLGQGDFFRRYYEVHLVTESCSRIRLGEGQGFDFFSPARVVDDPMITPYDRFALYLHCKRDRFPHQFKDERGTLRVETS